MEIPKSSCVRGDSFADECSQLAGLYMAGLKTVEAEFGALAAWTCSLLVLRTGD